MTGRDTVKEVFVLTQKVSSMVCSSVLGLYEGKTGTVTLDLANGSGPDYVVEVKTKRVRAKKAAKKVAAKKVAKKKVTRKKKTA